MGSGNFSFNISNILNNKRFLIDVRGAQIEIDAAYEGVESLAIIKAKRDISEDFLVRQLYYPFRTWNNNLTKKVRPIFLMYSNGIYRLFEYKFTDIKNYDSLLLVKQKNYSIECTDISLADIEDIFSKVQIQPEPQIAFPQADKFERVINICELLKGQTLGRNDITEQYAFDVRQTNYYTDAGRYLGLIDKYYEERTATYKLTPLGEQILSLGFKARQLAFCKCILAHQVYYDTIRSYLNTGIPPEKYEIVSIMKSSKLFQVESDSTYERRASTVRGWINWILSLKV